MSGLVWRWRQAELVVRELERMWALAEMRLATAQMQQARAAPAQHGLRAMSDGARLAVCGLGSLWVPTAAVKCSAWHSTFPGVSAVSMLARCKQGLSGRRPHRPARGCPARWTASTRRSCWWTLRSRAGASCT